MERTCLSLFTYIIFEISVVAFVMAHLQCEQANGGRVNQGGESRMRSSCASDGSATAHHFKLLTDMKANVSETQRQHRLEPKKKCENEPISFWPGFHSVETLSNWVF